MRRAPIILGVLSIFLLGACGASTPPGRSRHGAQAAPGSNPAGTSPATKGGGGRQGTPGTAGSGAGAGAGSSGAAQAAATAISRYVQAIVKDNASDLVGSADGAALAMAAVLLDSTSINRARGATTTVTVGSSTLVASATSSTSVTFGGSLTLTTAISGSQGSGTYTDTISGPLTVANEHGTWRVTGFTYDAQPVVEWPENVSQSIGQTHVSVGYVVSYGDLTAVLVTLGQQSGSASVQLQRTTLQTSAGSTDGTGDFTFPPTPTGVLRFSRIGSAPTGLVLQFNSSTGQAYDFDFGLH